MGFVKFCCFPSSRETLGAKWLLLEAANISVKWCFLVLQDPSALETGSQTRPLVANGARLIMEGRPARGPSISPSMPRWLKRRTQRRLNPGLQQTPLPAVHESAPWTRPSWPWDSCDFLKSALHWWLYPAPFRSSSLYWGYFFVWTWPKEITFSPKSRVLCAIIFENRYNAKMAKLWAILQDISFAVYTLYLFSWRFGGMIYYKGKISGVHAISINFWKPWLRVLFNKGFFIKR